MGGAEVLRVAAIYNTAMYTITSTLLLLIIVNILCSSLLIHGARTGRPGFLIPWLVLVAMAMGMEIGLIIGGVMIVVGVAVVGSSISTAVCVVSSIGVVILLLALIEQWYYFSCVWSLRRQLKTEAEVQDMVVF